MLEIAVIEEINAGLRKAAEQHEPPEAVDRFDGREVQVARKGRGRAEEDEHNKVVVIRDHVGVLVETLLRGLDDKGVGRDAHGAEDKEQVGRIEAHPAKVNPQDEQHAKEHHERADPVGEVELLVIEDHRDEVDHQHVGFEKRRAGGQRAVGIAEIGEEVQQKAEHADHNEDQDGFSLVEEAGKVPVEQQLCRQEEQRGAAQQKAREIGRARHADHDLGHGIVDRPGDDHGADHEGVFQSHFHLSASNILRSASSSI